MQGTLKPDIPTDWLNKPISEPSRELFWIFNSFHQPLSNFGATVF